MRQSRKCIRKPYAWETIQPALLPKIARFSPGMVSFPFNLQHDDLGHTGERVVGLRFRIPPALFSPECLSQSHSPCKETYIFLQG